MDSEPEPSSIVSESPGRSAGLTRRFTTRLIAVLAGAAVLACTPDQHRAGNTGSDGSGLAIVTHVVDGDTIDVEIAGSTAERVRLIGIDTPETVSRAAPVQCYGAEASDALRELLPEGTSVRLERDAEARDRYGRLLAYVHRIDDGLFVNQWMIDQGFANAAFYEPNTTFEADFSKREAQARSVGAGLWAICDGPDQPLEEFPDSATVEP